jgi:hypothetical protein
LTPEHPAFLLQHWAFPNAEFDSAAFTMVAFFGELTLVRHTLSCGLRGTDSEHDFSSRDGIKQREPDQA